MTRFPEGFEEPVRLPESFGSEAFRGVLGGAAVILLPFTLTPNPAKRTQTLRALARRWETLTRTSDVLAKPLRWFLEGNSFFVILSDPGGPLVTEVFDLPDGAEKFELALLPFLDHWGLLADQGASFSVLDPCRLILSPNGLQSFDLNHLIELSDAFEAENEAFVTVADLVLLAPEMTRRTSLPIDLRTGLFSLGNLLFRLATGHWPLPQADALEMVHSLLTRAPDYSSQRLADQGPVPLAIVQKLLQKDPRERYQTLRGLKWDLGQRGRNLTEFTPGVHDRALPIAEVRRTYGRHKERGHLTAALKRLGEGQSVVLAFRGAGGQGKSRLVDDLKHQAEAGGARWLQGKFDQYNHRFSAGALVSILEKWVESTPSSVLALSGMLRTRLGRNLRILSAIVPALTEVWEPGPELPRLGPEESLQRFIDTLVAFFGVLAMVQPLVLVVEDIHWADDLSLRVLEALARTPAPRLALVGTCRPGDDARLQAWLTIVAGSTGPGQGLYDLGPLEERDILELLTESADLEASEAQILARSLLRSSSGNPFALRMLLREVNLRQVIVFNEKTGRWSLQADRLSDLPGDQDSGLLVSRLDGMDLDVRRALLGASLLGFRFRKEDVLTAGEIPPERFDESLEELVELGVWERLGPAEYRFGHDKVRQVIYESATPEERLKAHLRLGRMRLTQWRGGKDLGASGICIHLNRSPSELSDDEKADLVTLNIGAGEQARQNNDFAAGLDFFRAAISLGGAALWERDPAAALSLYKAAAEVAYTGFRRELADQWCDEAVAQKISALERAKIRERQQNLLFYLGDLEGSIQAGIQGLRELGVSISAHPGTIQVLRALLGVKASLLGKTGRRLAEQPINTNEGSRTAMLLLSGFIPPAFHSGRQNLFALAVLNAVRLTHRDGLCAESAPSYTGYSLLLSALGDPRGAYTFGRLAADLNERFDDVKWRSMVLVLTGLFSHGWFEPWNRLRPRFEAARRASEESGDFLYRSYADLFATLWNPGDDLPRRLERTQEALALILKYRFPLTRVSAFYVLAGLRNLAEPSLEPLSFNSEGFDANEGLEEYRRQESKSGLAVCHSAVLKTAFLLGDHDLAREAMADAEEFRPAIAGSLYEEELTLFSGLLTADLVRHGLIRSSRGLSRSRRRAVRWARCSPTFQLHSALLRGEEYDLQQRTAKAQAAYLEAIEAADESGMLDYQALTRERASEFFGRRGASGLSRYFRDGAVDHWRSYGAWAKVALMESATPGTTLLRPWTKKEISGTDMDLASLVRALEAISREIQVEPLTRTVTKLILENSGADRVALLVPSGTDFVLEGEATAAGFRSGDRRPLAELADLPQVFLRRALASRKTLVVEDVTDLDRKVEPVLAARGVKSLICLPLVSPEGLRALVYLENTVMAGILTQGRIRILELLSSTIGVALQNAQLFQEVRHVNEGLERRVEERTIELQASQKKIILQEKLASLGALTAGIAHELKNPFNIINNFAESSIELFGELQSALEPSRPILPETVRAELDYLLPELAQNLRDMAVHGRRGDAIIRSMLMHSRSDGGEATVEDLETLVRESMGLSYHAMRASNKDFECRTETQFDLRVPPFKMIRPNLGRVLINLFTNAFQAVAEKHAGGKPEDWQGCVTASSEWLGTGVRLVVEDNGAGIAPELLDKIFQPFFTTKAPGEGTGLGLSISHEIIREEFGGTLEALCASGKTQFVITVPIAGAGKD